MLCQLLLGAVAALSGPGDVPAAPPPPDMYDVQIRYRISAYRNEHVAQYYNMLRHFKEAGFVRDPDDEPQEDEPENARYDRMIGTIPADKAHLLLDERHVEVIQLLPKGVKPPADANALVRVELRVMAGLPADRQRLLHGQVKAAIADLPFQEAVGYDTRGFTRLLGTVPAGQLDALLSDVRQRPGAPKAVPLQAPQLFWPIRMVEVRPDLPMPAARPEPPAIAKGQEKLTPELRELLGDAAKAAALTRMEVILAQTPADGEHAWANGLLLAAPGLVVEGRLGPLASVRVAPSQAPALAALAEVAMVRLPRTARPRLETAEAVEGWEPLRASGLVRLHLLNHKGQGTRLAVIDGDFSGWRALVGKQLPEDTRLIDLTRSRNEDLEPDPNPGDGKALGHGTHMALAVMRAAPEVELVLIRIDPAAPYLFQQAARAINGEDANSENLRNRLAKFDADRFLLDQQLTDLLEERRQLFKKFTDVAQKPLLLKKKEKGVLSLDEEAQLAEILKREDYDKKQADWDKRDRDYHEAVGRYFQLLKDLQNLKNVRVVASGLVWNEGHPADASSPLTRYFDDHAFGAALWFQSAGDARGQAWSGLYRDDGAGVMQFDAADATHPEALWRRQLDFLAWKPDGGKTTDDLPTGARARVSLQWREAHDPSAGRPGEDPYLKPLADLRIVLLYQPDPAGAKQPADDLEVVAQSVGLPQRLEATPSSAVYEQTVEVRVAKPGRYAVRIEGTAPTSTRSREDPTIPAARRTFELRPRLFVETLDGPGRVLLQDYVTEIGTIGMPADSRGVLTVGAADSHGRPERYSAGGPPYNVSLLFKPDLLAYDQVEAAGKDAARGAGVATGFAAGTAAVSRGPSSPEPARWRESLGVEPGGVVHVPEDWPRK